MSKGTDRRTVRIAPELWDAARAVAHERGETISDVIRRDLTEYIRSADIHEIYDWQNRHAGPTRD